MIALILGCRNQIVRDPKKRISYTVETCFSAAWLDAKAENDVKGRTNRQVQIAVRGWPRQIVSNDGDADNPQAIQKARSGDTHPETTGIHLADVGRAHTPRATRTSRPNITNDPEGVDPHGG